MSRTLTLTLRAESSSQEMRDDSSPSVSATANEVGVASSVATDTPTDSANLYKHKPFLSKGYRTLLIETERVCHKLKKLVQQVS